MVIDERKSLKIMKSINYNLLKNSNIYLMFIVNGV